MKEAKKYEGRKILVKVESGDKNTDYSKKINIVRSLESFKNDVENDMYTSVELIEDNLTLYQCDVKKTSDLAKIHEIRSCWAKGKFNYDIFLTKNEIKELLENDALVAINGLQEIELEDLEKLS
ncbi:MAG: hypothetical protein HFJ52_03950 [Clostridia bacterium]|jgi:hypothetical protein|nr:hypothetical protein [Clostridia bacterium]